VGLCTAHTELLRIVFFLALSSRVVVTHDVTEAFAESWECNVLMTVRWLKAMIPPRHSNETVRVGDTLSTTFRVLPSDLDMLMHMTNGRYLSVLDAARISYMSRTGRWRRYRERGWHPVVVSQTISYRRSLTLGVKYAVHTTLLGFDTRNGYFEHSFHVGSGVYATAVVAVRYLDKNGASVTPDRILKLDVDFALPHTLPEWVEDWASAARAHTTATSEPKGPS